jgi:peptidoglycan/xylan/chitin deacetylase (PgdA/CDA1 family)
MSSTVSNGKPPMDSSSSPGFTVADWLWRLLPLIVFVFLAVTQTGLTRGDAAGVYTTAASLAEHGSFAIDGYIAALAPRATAADAPPTAYPLVAYVAGHYYHAVPPGRALIAMPFYALGASLVPLLGAEAPAILVLLLGPLLGALIVAIVLRHRESLGLGRARGGWVIALALVFMLYLWGGGLSVPLVAAALVACLAPAARDLWQGGGSWRAALGVGALLGALVLVDYLLGLLAVLLLLALAARVCLRQRRFVAGLALLLAGGVPIVALLAWQTAAFGVPWRLAFRSAVDPAGRSLGNLFSVGSIAALGLAVAVGGLLLIPATTHARDRRWLALPIIGGVVSVGLAAPRYLANWDGVILPIRWWSAAPLVTIISVGFLLASGMYFLPPYWRRIRPRTLPTAALLGFLLLPSSLFTVAPRVSAAAATPVSAVENYAAPFAIETTGGVRALWSFAQGRGQAMPARLRLDAAAAAISPWIDLWPGSAYELRLRGDRSVQVIFGWETVAREPLVVQSAAMAANGGQAIRFAAPPGAAGLRLRLVAADGPVTVTDLELRLVAGVRVEPFPDGHRAALAFSFDWESAMGGLIHSRSSGEGEGATVGLRDDGGPSVAQAEEKGQRMRDGARFLAVLFARYGIKATFYSTGYNLIDGNPTCQKFLGDPIYRNANMANGWGSDWWRTHPWYGDDPCSTEAQAPAWYFASETRELAGAGHEIASHTFGHLYVRGVTPDQLGADLDQWVRSATALGLPPARSFAFPWTSSNSLDAPFWAVFERVGMTVLTRLYQTQAQPLPHPYELDRIKGQPNLIAFPDYYLASHAEAQDEALARIDVTLALRGYHSLWDHPNEALEQGGQVIWSRVVDYAAAQRERGLWIAPVTEIATYGVATRQVALTALPVAGGTRLIVDNRSDRALNGLTLRLPGAGSRAEAIIPALAAGGTATITVGR